MEFFPQPISEQIWGQKYRFQTDRDGFKSDVSVADTWERLAQSCADLPRLHNQPEMKSALADRFFSAVEDFKFLPAGRIISGAGTARNVTLFNCFVMGTVPDSLDGIFDMLKEAALTMQQGGGIGYDFSTLRPKGAPVKGVESFSSGPLTFMDVWDSMCKTIMSAGSRRGAMMATMRCDHPDIMEFVTAKRDPLRLRNFNVSVLCTDRFMDAVKNDLNWSLVFDNRVYSTMKARDLWDAILENTYNYAEPGVIFIDRINQTNNLWAQEKIAATNPCGEQPLPPYGACLLGSINLAKMVVKAFQRDGYMDMELLTKTVKTAVRMLDAVIDTSGFPLEEQRQEALHKRRMGLGVTGLADALFMLGYKYGSEEAVEFTEWVMRAIAIAAYEESILMAQEIGPAPCLQEQEDRQDLITSGFMKGMPDYIRQDILEHGLRNALLLSIAPTGTISMYAGNVSSGVEPIFAPSFTRKVTNDDGTKREEKVFDYAVLEYERLLDEATPGNEEEVSRLKTWWYNHMATAQDLTPHDHIVMQAAAQKWVDSSISKTVNCPVDITFGDFKEVYWEAWETGCKGCTTYRPNDVTGSVLSVETKEEEPDIEEDTDVLIDEEYDGDMRVVARGKVMDGSTYKLRWGNDSYYVTFNNTVDPEHDWFMPFELFINSKTVEHHQWTAAMTRMISAVFQRGGDIRFVAEELKQIHDPKGGQWVEGRYYPSLVSLIGQTLEEHLMLIGYQSTPEQEEDDFDPNAMDVKIYHDSQPEQSPDTGATPDQCPSCKGYNIVTLSGCPTCQECGYSKCG